MQLISEIIKRHLMFIILLREIGTLKQSYGITVQIPTLIIGS
ncbi:hypothetical protein VCRA2119O48_110056 [Vibrio crassostreae]|nr:hypothetical protein VCRA2118O41_380011 [Vibrio crassostreae]CAK2396640.1 hypothetical protein VCRA2119O48_110056 [Vibrio crassostreae]CAK3924205.1 hypothetical protein VCRA212O16_380053 [Vibrio crassostreae]